MCVCSKKTERRHSKVNTASTQVACSCTSRHVYCVQEEGQLSGTEVNFTASQMLGLFSFFIDPLLICLGGRVYSGQI